MMTTTTTPNKTLVNNEGKKIKVDLATYEELKKDFNGGVWLVIIHDVTGDVHTVILPDNFTQETA
jgi:hypothetical protein